MNVATLSQNGRLQSSLLEIQSRIVELQGQVSSGKKADTFSGLGTRTRASIDFRTAQSRLETYQTNITTIEVRINFMEPILTRIGDMANEVRDEILKARDGTAPNTTFIRQKAVDRINEMVRLLNFENDGRFLFAGTNIDDAPMLDPAALSATVNGTITGYTTADAAARLTTARANVDPAAYYGGSTGPDQISGRIDDNVDLEYGLRGDNPAFRSIFQGLYVAANLEYDAAEADGFWTLLEGAAADLKTGFDNLQTVVATLGDKAAVLDKVNERHTNSVLLINQQIGIVEDVDVAEAIQKLFAAQAQLQSSYELIASMRDLTLARFI